MERRKIFHVKIASFISMNDGGKSIFAFKGFFSNIDLTTSGINFAHVKKYVTRYLKISMQNRRIASAAILIEDRFYI